MKLPLLVVPLDNPLVLLPPLDNPLQGRVLVPQVGIRPHQLSEDNRHQQQGDNHRPQLQ